MPAPTHRRVIVALVVALSASCRGVEAQAPPRAAPPRAAAGDAGMISLNFPENLELKVFVEYVSQRLKVNILYDEQIATKRVTIRSPAQVPASSLLGLLESVVKMKGMALVDADQPGWKRIVPVKDLVEIAGRPSDAPTFDAGAGATAAATQIFALQHADTKSVVQVIKPFLSQPGANTVEVADQNILIVTDFASNMRRIDDLIKLVDQPRPAVVIEFVPVKNMEAATLAPQVTQLLTAKNQAQGDKAQSPRRVDLAPDVRSNQIAVIGTRDRVDEARQIIESLDVGLDLTTRVYQFAAGSPERVDRLARELIGPLDAGRLYRSTVDRDAGLLVATTTDQVHRRLEALKAELDVPVTEAQSRVRFYRLTNATATDVLATIRAIEGGGAAGQRASLDLRDAPSQRFEPSPLVPGGNRPPALPGQPPLTPPIYRSDRVPGAAGSGGAARGAGGNFAADSGAARRAVPQTIHTHDATVTADPNTNSVIIVAEPGAQQVYEQLIRQLDRRRPQVLVEVTIVTIDTSNNFALGVEIGGDARSGKHHVLTFNSFGLSDVDVATGGLSVLPGLGFNGALISPDVADVVIHALSSSNRARVVSAPRILVNDNATGTLSSIAEEPFTSVNASQTVATTSFAGFVSAGTDITVTPQISEGEHVKLRYSIALNSFSGQGGQGVPPPRQTDAVQSDVTIPDGNTIIIGGLNRSNSSETVQSIPLLGDIPIIKHAFSNRTETRSNTTLFVFMRPIILRDDRFEDLKFLSRRDLAVADLPSDDPVSAPMIVR